jgi:phosphomannomutase
VDNLLFGYEEAIGYCVDPTVVNDKDGISAALIIIKLANELKRDGISLLDYLNNIGEEYGFHETEQISIRFTDLSQIDKLLSSVIKNPPVEIAGSKLLKSEDLSALKGMATPGVRLWYENQTRVIIRPSGTEPKIKCYIEVVSHTKNDAKSKVSQIKEALTKVLS